MNNLLYYPYIDLPKTDWTLRILLYYHNIGSIVPQEYFYEPERNYDPFMLELVREQLVTPLNPMDVLDNPWESTIPFIEHIQNNQERLRRVQNRFRNAVLRSDQFIMPRPARVHSQKFDDNIFNNLIDLQLAERADGNWYNVERRTANELMKFLATVVSAKTNRIPTSDWLPARIYRSPFAEKQRKRRTILTRLIPFPQDIDFLKLMKFKEKHGNLLDVFRVKVESLVLEPNIQEDTEQFDLKMSELLIHKRELSAKMNESKFNDIVYGSICGVIGAGYGLATSGTPGAFLGSLPGFTSAVQSALKIEKPEDVFDQSGMKYLALADRQLSKR